MVVTVVQQSDIDAVRTALSSQLTADLQSALQQKAQNLHYIADAAPALTASSDVSAGAHGNAFVVLLPLATALLGVPVLVVLWIWGQSRRSR